ncbi:unnamed protein product [Durusdinium trenchii]
MRPRDLVAKQCGLDEDVLEELKRHGFPREYAINCLQNNKHNSVTTTYYLLAAKRRRMMEHLQMEERSRGTQSRFTCHTARGLHYGPKARGRTTQREQWRCCSRHHT